MQAIDKVKKQIELLGEIDSFGTKKEINYLPEILREDEKICGITSGIYKSNTWLITLTDTRLIFLDKGMIYGLEQIEIPCDKINSVEFKTGLILADIIVWDGASKVLIENVDKRLGKVFVDAINSTLHTYKHKPTSSAPIDVATQLEKLAVLKEKGVLSEDEFKEQKKKLLAA